MALRTVYFCSGWCWTVVSNCTRLSFYSLSSSNTLESFSACQTIGLKLCTFEWHESTSRTRCYTSHTSVAVVSFITNNCNSRVCTIITLRARQAFKLMGVRLILSGSTHSINIRISRTLAPGRTGSFSLSIWAIESLRTCKCWSINWHTPTGTSFSIWAG